MYYGTFTLQTLTQPWHSSDPIHCHQKLKVHVDPQTSQHIVSNPGLNSVSTPGAKTKGALKWQPFQTTVWFLFCLQKSFYLKKK